MTNLTVSMYQTLFQRKTTFMLKSVAFGVFPGDKDEYVNVCIVKIKIRTDQVN